MKSSTARRLGTAGVAAMLSVSFLAAPPPSNAVVIGVSMVAAEVNFDDDPDVGVTCNQAGLDASAIPGPVAADGVPVTRSASSNAVITDNANVTDKTTMSGTMTHTVTATQAKGQLSKVHLASTASASVTTAIANTKCHGAVYLSGGTQFQFDLVSPALVTVTAEAHRMVGIVQVGSITGGNPSDIEAVVAYALGKHGTSTGTVLLPAGINYMGVNEVQFGLEASAVATTLSESGDVTVDLSFDVPGSASAAQSGKGGKYVNLADGRDCTAGALSMTWSKKAGKGNHRVIKKAIVRVNGDKVATIKKPTRKTVATITGLNTEKAADVEVTLKVKGKGSTTVDRSYLRCS
jgi:hypothetical protein